MTLLPRLFLKPNHEGWGGGSKESSGETPHDMCQTATVPIPEVPSLVADDNHAGEGMPPHLMPGFAMEALPTGMEAQRGALSQAPAIEHKQDDSNSILAGSHREWQCVNLAFPSTAHVPGRPTLHQYQRQPADWVVQSLQAEAAPSQLIHLAPMAPVGLPRGGELPVIEVGEPSRKWTFESLAAWRKDDCHLKYYRLTGDGSYEKPIVIDD